MYHKSYYEKSKKQKVDLKKQYYIEHKEESKAYYMKNNEIRKKQNHCKIDMKDVLSEKNSLYYQENIDFFREKQSE